MLTFLITAAHLGYRLPRPDPQSVTERERERLGKVKTEMKRNGDTEAKTERRTKAEERE